MEIMNKSKKLFNGQQKAKQRRESAIIRLQEQLKLGLKTVKDDFQEIPGITAHPLTESDITRIKKELSTLKSRV
jgi:hypothetical protein